MQFISTGTLEDCQNDSILTETLSDFFKSESGRFEPTTPSEREKKKSRERERDIGKEIDREIEIGEEIDREKEIKKEREREILTLRWRSLTVS